MRFISATQTKQKLCFAADLARKTTAGKTIAAVAVILIVNCLVPSLEAKDIIRDKSPDGKFALRISKDEQGGSAAIIDLKSKDEVVTLEVYQNNTEEAHLVWSKDSQRVAYFEPDRRGGSTTVYFRNGSKFEEVTLPDIPECKNPSNEGETPVKTVETTISPQKWLSSDTLVLRVNLADLMEKGGKQWARTCAQIVTVVFDSSHKASIQSAKQVKSD